MLVPLTLDPGQVKITMRSIKHTLTERFYNWEDAVKLAKEDPEINLSGKGPAYTPMVDYVYEDVLETDEAESEPKDTKAAEEALESREGLEQSDRQEEQAQTDGSSSGSETVDPSTIPKVSSTAPEERPRA
jgi:hypothetical protein